MLKMETTLSTLHDTNTADTEIFKSICADFEDVLLSDLHDTISRLLHKPYLQESTDITPAPLIQGIVWGTSLRPIISLNVQLAQPIITLSGTRSPIHVHFLYLAASPQTFMSDQALRALGIEDMVVVGHAQTGSSTSSMRLPLKINGCPILVARSPPDSHFAHLNILGQDFIHLARAHVYFGGQVPQFLISFS